MSGSLCSEQVVVHCLLEICVINPHPLLFLIRRTIILNGYGIVHWNDPEVNYADLHLPV
jgi:hypothetical protein